MANVNGSIYIERPPQVVFDFVADERNEPRYNAKMTDVSLLTEEPIGAGARFAATLTSRAWPIALTVEFTDFVRPTRIASVSTGEGIETIGALSFAPSGKGTLMRWSWDINLHGLAKVASPVVAWMGRRRERVNWSSLKRYLESEEEPTHA